MKYRTEPEDIPGTTLPGQPLDEAEETWVKPYNFDDLPLDDLDGPQRKALFLRIWTKEETAGWCRTCKRSEGLCEEPICIRLRVTHKLGLPWEWAA